MVQQTIAKLYEIKFEDLVASPESQLKKIVSFLGIEYEKSMLNYSKNVENKVGKLRLEKHHSHLKEKPNIIDKWINAGVYFFSQDVFSYLPDKGNIETTALPAMADQQKLKAVLLSHYHYDHIRDIPALAINFSTYKNTINIYCTQLVYDIIANNLLDGKLYPNFMERPSEKPSVRINLLEPKPSQITFLAVL